MNNRIRELRQRIGLTQEEVAVLAGTTETSLSRWERGERPLTPAIISILTKIFKIRSWELFFDRTQLRRGAAAHALIPLSPPADSEVRQ